MPPLWRQPRGNSKFFLPTPKQMLPESGGICGRLTYDLPLGCHWLRGSTTAAPATVHSVRELPHAPQLIQPRQTQFLLGAQKVPHGWEPVTRIHVTGGGAIPAGDPSARRALPVAPAPAKQKTAPRGGRLRSHALPFLLGECATGFWFGGGTGRWKVGTWNGEGKQMTRVLRALRR